MYRFIYYFSIFLFITKAVFGAGGTEMRGPATSDGGADVQQWAVCGRFAGTP